MTALQSGLYFCGHFNRNVFVPFKTLHCSSQACKEDEEICIFKMDENMPFKDVKLSLLVEQVMERAKNKEALYKTCLILITHTR